MRDGDTHTEKEVCYYERVCMCILFIISDSGLAGRLE